MMCLARTKRTATYRLSSSLRRGLLSLVLAMTLAAVSPTAQASCEIGRTTNAATMVKAVAAERKALEELAESLQEEIKRLQAALKDMRDDGKFVKFMRSLFGDEPTYDEIEQLQQVLARTRELQEYLTALHEEQTRLLTEIQECQRQIQAAIEARKEALDNLTGTRAGKNTTRNNPTIDLNSMASSSDERETGADPPPSGIGLGDGGTP